MPRIKITDLNEEHILSENEIKSIKGGYFSTGIVNMASGILHHSSLVTDIPSESSTTTDNYSDNFFSGSGKPNRK